MSRKTTYQCEDENGVEHTYEVFYDINTPYAFMWGDEPDLEAVTIERISENGMVLEHPEENLVNDIKHWCLEEYDDDTWTYDED